MYGDLELLTQHKLLYGLSKQFFELFSPLQYLGLELPLLLSRNFHVYLRPLIDSGPDYSDLSASGLPPMRDFAEVQKALQRKPAIRQDLSGDRGRNTIAAQVHFLPFLLERFPQTKVLLILNSGSEDRYLTGYNLPSIYRIRRVAEEARAARLDAAIVAGLLQQCDLLLNQYGLHPVFGQQDFRLWLRKHLPVAMKFIEVLTRWFAEENIGLILCYTEMVNPGTTLSLLASQHNLPFVNAPLHLVTDQNIIPTRASHYCVWGKNYREWLIKRGIPSSKLSCTGNLRFEYEQKKVYPDPSALRSRYQIPGKHFILLYTTQPHPEEVRRLLFTWVAEAAAGLPVTVLVKRHSRDNLDYDFLKKMDQVIMAPPAAGLYDLLPAADFLATVSSTTAIEAAMLQKGIVVLQPEIPYFFTGNSHRYHQHLVQAEAGFVAYSPADLRKIMHMLCFSRQYRSRLQRTRKTFLNDTIHRGALSAPSEDVSRVLLSLLPTLP